MLDKWQKMRGLVSAFWAGIGPVDCHAFSDGSQKPQQDLTVQRMEHVVVLELKMSG